MPSDEDDYVCYGNALEPIDEDSIPRKKPITVEDQYAKDERGRRRFHGAFTGGFSAGFYNSVGSMEGWQPTNFVSSRSSRTRSKDQTIFDFMDDEDTGEYGICPVSLQVKPAFDTKSTNSEPSNRKKRGRMPTNDERRVLDAAFVKEMLAPARDTVGIKLLVKMGWRPGQGIGPRLNKRAKKLEKRHRPPGDVGKIYGCRLPADMNATATATETETDYDSHPSSSEPEFDDHFDDVTFAPNDYQAYIVSPKQNAFGLGYRGIDRKPVLSSERSESSVLTVAGKSIRGQAFGVSVFEDDDDDDIYGTEDMSNYDFSLPYAGEPKITPKKITSSKCTTNCIDGFCVSTTTTAASKARQPFVLPSIPADFQPVRMKKNRWDCAAKTGDRDLRGTKISSASERSELLSQIDDDDDDENMNGVRGVDIRISDIPLPEETSYPRNRNDEIASASNATGCMKPFAYDAQKQDRYEKFLTRKNCAQFQVAAEISHVYPANMTEWEKEREKSEFQQAARLYRPLAEDLASRFTRGSQNENVHDVAAPVEKSYDAESEILRNAAKSNMYGALTRKKHAWKPERVICKRFNIPEPFDDTSCNVSAARASKPTHRNGSLFEFLKMSASNVCAARALAVDGTLPSTATPSHPDIAIPSEQSPPQKANADAANHQTRENEKDDQIDKITDKIDLFKAIFLSSSDDESENENETEFPLQSQGNVNADMSTTTTTTTPPSPSCRADKTQIRYSPARGIFANLDLESLKCTPSFRKNEQEQEHIETTTDTVHADDASSETNANDALLYGPKIPSSLLSVANANTSQNTRRFQRDCSPAREIRSRKSRHSSSSVWIEKSDKCKTPKHKKHRKKQKKSKRRKGK